MSYTREQCLNWIRDPTQNPKTGEPFGGDDRDLFVVFVGLRDECQKFFTPQEIEKINPEMIPIIFLSSTPQPQTSIPRDVVLSNSLKKNLRTAFQ